VAAAPGIEPRLRAAINLEGRPAAGADTRGRVWRGWARGRERSERVWRGRFRSEVPEEGSERGGGGGQGIGEKGFAAESPGSRNTVDARVEAWVQWLAEAEGAFWPFGRPPRRP
jgi:hypothetical protein